MNDTERQREREHLLLTHLMGEIGLWDLDTRTGIAWRNLRHDQIFGYEELLPEWSYEMFLEHVVPEDREKVGSLFGAAIQNNQQWSFECRINRADGDEAWIRAHGKPVPGLPADEQRLLGSVVDISRARRTEERMQLLTAELNHRERNLLATMQAMVKMSAKSASDVSQLEASLAGRLAVLARTHDLFVSESSDRIPILQIILAEMAATQVPPERFKVQGRTELALQAKTAESATLILHELITNARRHGALSNDTGRITLRIEPQGEKEARIVWTESNGPKVAFPKHEGFGLNIMQTALGVDGDVKMEYRLDGIQCTIDLRSSRPRPVMEMARTTVVPQEKPDLTGKRILILEDEALIALSLEMTLTDEGAEVVGPFSSSSQALTALDEDIDAAILDVNLGRTTSLDVAHRLKERGVPFVFVTGDGDWHQVSEAFPDVPVLDKPIRELEVVMNLGRVL